MSWVRLDDGFHRNDKQLRMSDGAFRVYVCAMSWCAQAAEPTGYLATAQARALVASLGKRPQVIAELVRLNAWEEADGGYFIHDYEEYIERGSRDRVRQWRAGKKLAGITEAQMDSLRAVVFERDGFRCRYCGATPSRKLLVADHVIPTPEGPTTEGNLVTACRSCNRRKGGRTPAEAGMLLSPVTSSVTSSVTLPVTPAEQDRVPDRNSSVTPLARDGYPVPEPVPVVTSPQNSSETSSDELQAPSFALTSLNGTFADEFDHFVAELNHATGRRFRGDAASRKLYARVRHEGRSVADLLAAARGVAKSAHHMGLNDNGIPYNAPANILRSKVLDQLISLGNDEIGIVRRLTADERREAEIDEWARRSEAGE